MLRKMFLVVKLINKLGLIVGRMEIDNKLILDAFPLSHTRILSPTLEIAFEIVY